MPEFHKKEEAEKLVSDVKDDDVKSDEKEPKLDETDSFLKKTPTDINITDEVPSNRDGNLMKRHRSANVSFISLHSRTSL